MGIMTPDDTPASHLLKLSLLVYPSCPPVCLSHTFFFLIYASLLTRHQVSLLLFFILPISFYFIFPQSFLPSLDMHDFYPCLFVSHLNYDSPNSSLSLYLSTCLSVILLLFYFSSTLFRSEVCASQEFVSAHNEKRAKGEEHKNPLRHVS